MLCYNKILFVSLTRRSVTKWIVIKPFSARVTFQSTKVFVAMALTSFLVAACGITAGRIAVTFFAKGIIVSVWSACVAFHAYKVLFTVTNTAIVA